VSILDPVFRVRFIVWYRWRIRRGDPRGRPGMAATRAAPTVAPIRQRYHSFARGDWNRGNICQARPLRGGL